MTEATVYNDLARYPLEPNAKQHYISGESARRSERPRSEPAYTTFPLLSDLHNGPRAHVTSTPQCLQGQHRHELIPAQVEMEKRTESTPQVERDVHKKAALTWSQPQQTGLPRFNHCPPRCSPSLHGHSPFFKQLHTTIRKAPSVLSEGRTSHDGFKQQHHVKARCETRRFKNRQHTIHGMCSPTNWGGSAQRSNHKTTPLSNLEPHLYLHRGRNSIHTPK